jgi:hypothetical protein
MKADLGMASRTWVLSIVSIFVGLATCGTLRAQNPLQVIGEPQWEVKDGMCKFTIAGGPKIINQGPADYQSGSLRLDLVMTSSPFPAAGKLVAYLDLGPLPGQYEIANFSSPTPATIPPETGFRYLTLVIEEFTNTGWVPFYAGRSVVNYLKDGLFSPPPLWKPAKGRVIPVPDTKPTGKKVTFNQKGLQIEGKPYIIPKFNEFSTSARLGRSGRTVTYIGSDPVGNGGDWSYKSGKAKWNGKTQNVGTLVIDYGILEGKRAKSTYWLFFQKKGRGFYKVTNQSGKDSFTAWGSFTLQ